MFDQLPKDARLALDWNLEQYAPFNQALLDTQVTAENLSEWLTNWSHLMNLVGEVYSRLSVAVDIDTTDSEAEKRYLSFLQNVLPDLLKVNNQLNIKLVESGLEPENFEVPLRNMRVAVEIFRDENVPIQTELQQLGNEYDKILGAQTIMWEGEEKTIAQMRPVFMQNDRTKREEAFQLIHERQIQDRQALNDLWVKMFKLRQQMARNAGFDNFLEYQWKNMNRFDYTPEDSRSFHAAIEQVVVPAAERLHERRRQELGVDTLRPWDTEVDPQGREPLRPFNDEGTLKEGTSSIFNQVDPELGAYFQAMRDENLLDLANRKGKAPGGYCTSFDLMHKPFIFMNAVGVHDDLQTMLHEAGHAFHVFETASLPYHQQGEVPMEFAEVASMAMELLAAPYLVKDKGGFYSADESARARTEHLEGSILFWPYMAVVDAFQHWAYTSGDAALDPANCDAKWAELWQRFMHGVDYSGLEEWVKTGWHRKLHIFRVPFYYIEYGLAQLGAVQVWANSLKDHQHALNQYRRALTLGGTKPLPELYQSAGARLAFDADTLGQAVELMENTINSLNN